MPHTRFALLLAVVVAAAAFTVILALLIATEAGLPIAALLPLGLIAYAALRLLQTRPKRPNKADTTSEHL